VHGIGYAFQAGPGDAGGAGNEAPAGWLIGAGRRVAVFTGENVIGREGDGVIAVSSPTVSRRHARLTIDDRGATLEDLRSKNGTFINDQPLASPVPVSDGDIVRIGSIVLTFRLARPASSTQTL
jgi:pSer/pThr/pTyr-binding forkhead associated (FHA) protein